jgi:hypothetical protein
MFPQPSLSCSIPLNNSGSSKKILKNSSETLMLSDDRIPSPTCNTLKTDSSVEMNISCSILENNSDNNRERSSSFLSCSCSFPENYKEYISVNSSDSSSTLQSSSTSSCPPFDLRRQMSPFIPLPLPLPSSTPKKQDHVLGIVENSNVSSLSNNHLNFNFLDNSASSTPFSFYSSSPSSTLLSTNNFQNSSFLFFDPYLMEMLDFLPTQFLSCIEPPSPFVPTPTIPLFPENLIFNFFPPLIQGSNFPSTINKFNKFTHYSSSLIVFLIEKIICCQESSNVKLSHTQEISPKFFLFYNSCLKSIKSFSEERILNNYKILSFLEKKKLKNHNDFGNSGFKFQNNNLCFDYPSSPNRYTAISTESVPLIYHFSNIKRKLESSCNTIYMSMSSSFHKNKEEFSKNLRLEKKFIGSSFPSFPLPPFLFLSNPTPNVNSVRMISDDSLNDSFNYSQLSYGQDLEFTSDNPSAFSPSLISYSLLKSNNNLSLQNFELQPNFSVNSPSVSNNFRVNSVSFNNIDKNKNHNFFVKIKRPFYFLNNFKFYFML